MAAAGSVPKLPKTANDDIKRSGHINGLAPVYNAAAYTDTENTDVSFPTEEKIVNVSKRDRYNKTERASAFFLNNNIFYPENVYINDFIAKVNGYYRRFCRNLSQKNEKTVYFLIKTVYCKGGFSVK